MHACQDFKNSLPKNVALTHQNTQSHISMQEQTPYTLMHTVYLLCQIMLHREYVPFIPLRCKKPEGPLDPPLFSPDKYDVPPGFWTDSARQCFKSAREIMDLVRTCQEWNVLVETPIIGFAIYTVAFVGVYCINFPWMDPDGYMCTKTVPGSKGKTVAPDDSKGSEAARKALEIIGQMRPRLYMADGWFKTIKKMYQYLRRMTKDFRKNVQAANESNSESGGSPESSRQLTLREGGGGGGLDEYKLLERILKEFGNLDDEDIEMTDVQHTNKTLEAIYDDNSISGTTVKSEEGDRHHEQSRQDGPWNAINAAPGAGRQTPTSAPTSNGAWRSYETIPAHAPTYAQSAPPASYNQQPQLSNFRPIYQHQDSGMPPTGGMPSHASPDSRTAPPSSHHSPSFTHQQHPPYNSWTPQNAAYNMQPPGPGYGVHQHPHSTTPFNAMQAYPTPGSQQAQPMGPPQQMPEAPQIFDPVAKEAWLTSINTGLSGDDVAAFVDGGEMGEWALMASERGFGPNWLSTVWQGGEGSTG